MVLRLDEIEDRAELAGSDGTVDNVPTFLVEAAEQLVDHPVRGLLGVAALGHVLEIIGRFLLGDQHVGVIGAQAIVGDETRALGIGKLGQVLTKPIHIVLRQLERQQVGVREIAIIVRLLLRAHRARLTGLGVEQPRLLMDDAALLQDLDLAARLVLDGLADEADGVDVLDLASRAELLARAGAPTR